MTNKTNDVHRQLTQALDTLLEETRSLSARRAAVPARNRTYQQEIEHTRALDSVLEHIINCRQAADGPPVYYDGPDQESLHHTTLNDAVFARLTEDYHTPEDFPDFLTIRSFRRMIPTVNGVTYPSYLSPLESVLERLDEEHLDPEDTRGTTPTPEMQHAESSFIQAVLLQYRSYWCEMTTEFQVNVHTWLTAHHPDLLPIRSFAKSICGHCHLVRGTQEMRTCTACRKRGCSRCWRHAMDTATPWPRRSLPPNRCAFRSSNTAEQQKVARQYEYNSTWRGWGFHLEGPVNAE